MRQESVEVLIEIPRGSRNKYEYDKERGVFVLDRVLYSSVHYPTDYGYVPDTLAEDGDPVDVLVVVHQPTFPGCVVPTRPVGVLEMEDEKGLDHKVLGVPMGDPRFEDVRDLEDLGAHWRREIENFFATYKALEAKATVVRDWSGVEAAWSVIERGRAAYTG